MPIARRRNLAALWADRRIICDQDVDALIHVPAEALYYASLGCIEIARHDGGSATYYSGTSELQQWIEYGQHEEKARQGSKGLVSGDAEREDFLRKYVVGRPALDTPPERSAPQANDRAMTPVLVGCDFGSTTAKLAEFSPRRLNNLFDVSITREIRPMMICFRAAGRANLAVFESEQRSCLDRRSQQQAPACGPCRESLPAARAGWRDPRPVRRPGKRRRPAGSRPGQRPAPGRPVPCVVPGSPAGVRRCLNGRGWR